MQEIAALDVSLDDESRLTARQRAALRLANAFVTAPARIAGDLRGDVLAGLSPGEVVEVLFDVMAWSQQKVLVALALDAPVAADALTSLDFDDDGHAVVGAAPHERQV